MAKSTQIVTAGIRWGVEGTVDSARKNIFAFEGEHGAYHVGTFVSGSKTEHTLMQLEAKYLSGQTA